jgi:hypothetical protein
MLLMLLGSVLIEGGISVYDDEGGGQNSGGVDRGRVSVFALACTRSLNSLLRVGCV